MWRRVQVAGFVLLAILVSGVWFTGSGQDATELRLTALEARVADLEATVAVLGGGTVATPVIQTYTVHGTFQLGGTKGDDFYLIGGECYGDGGYDDIYPGARIRVKDGTGAILAVTELVAEEHTRKCLFTWEVEVPYSPFYEFAGGSDRRGGLTMTFEELEDDDWEVGLYLG